MIDRTYIMNLKRRTDRLEKILPAASELCNRIGALPPVVIEAIDGKERWPGYDHAGRAGFNKSTQTVLEHAYNSGFGSFLVLEDDAEFKTDASVILSAAMKDVPPDWDCLYLGANLRERLERYNQHWYRLKNAWTTHAIIYSRRAIEHILMNYRFPDKFEHSNDVYDEWMRTIGQEQLKCYIISPMIATQAVGFSDLEMKEVDYNCIRHNERAYMR